MIVDLIFYRESRKYGIPATCVGNLVSAVLALFPKNIVVGTHLIVALASSFPFVVNVAAIAQGSIVVDQETLFGNSVGMLPNDSYVDVGRSILLST